MAWATRLGSSVDSDQAAAIPVVPKTSTAPRSEGQSPVLKALISSTAKVIVVDSFGPQRSAARPTINWAREATTQLVVAYQAMVVLLAPAASSSKGIRIPMREE